MSFVSLTMALTSGVFSRDSLGKKDGLRNFCNKIK